MVIAGPVIVAGVASLTAALGISVALTPLVRRWALRRDFVDHPVGSGSHKTHEQPTAFGGGIVITVAVMLPMVLVLIAAKVLRPVDAERFVTLTAWAPDWPHWVGGIVDKTPEALAIIAGALVMHLLGIVDDHRPLSPLLKLAVQVGVALTLTAGFGIRAAEALGPAAAVAVTTIWIVTLTNAFNFMDNMDGLAAGVGALTAIILAIVLAVLLSFYVYVSTSYERGAIQVYRHVYFNWTHSSWNGLSRNIEKAEKEPGFDTDWKAVRYVGMGAVVMFFLCLMRQRYLWFVHPLGYVAWM